MSFEWEKEWKNIDVVKSSYAVEEYLDSHRRMWNYLVENPEMWKYEYPLSKVERKRWPHLHCCCFACQFAVDTLIHYKYGPGRWISTCDKCLLDWGREEGIYRCMNNLSVYRKYTNARLFGDLVGTSKMAAIIRDLPLSVFAQKVMEKSSDV